MSSPRRGKSDGIARRDRRSQNVQAAAELATAFCERSLSEATRATYERVLREFLAWLREDPREARADDVRRWRDALIASGQSAATVALKLSVVRSFYAYLEAAGFVELNPASARLVPAPKGAADRGGRVLTLREVRYLLGGPDQKTAEGARDHALLLLLARTGLRAREASSLRVSSIQRNRGMWVVAVRVKGGKVRELPLPDDLKAAIDRYLALDAPRRRRIHSDEGDPYLFQPAPEFFRGTHKPITVRTVERIVSRWAEYGGIKGRVSPHDLRRTAITRAFDLGLSYRQVQAMSGHADPKTVMRYDHHRENLEQNAIRFLHYEDGGA